jgi:protein SCO1/2
MNLQFIASVTLALALLTGCQAGRRSAAQASAGAAGVQVYHLRGKVVSIDAAHGILLVDSEAIPGFMAAMTMPYQLKNPGVAATLHPGDEITADLLVTKSSEDTMQLEHIAVAAQAKPK